MMEPDRKEPDVQSDSQAIASIESGLDLQNHSLITTASADKDNEIFSEPNSPLTSPLSTRTNHSESGKFSDAIPVIDKAALQKKFDDSVLSGSKELISLMKSLVEGIELKEPKLEELERNYSDKPDKFDWKVIIELSEQMFNEYSKEMERVTKEFDDLNKKLLIWQESVYVMDSEKVSKRLASQEKWLRQKELYLNYKIQELSNSAELIDSALRNLRNEKSD